MSSTAKRGNVGKASNSRVRIVFWGILLVFILAVGYFAFTSPTGWRNQCDNLSTSFTVTLGSGPMEIPVGLANIEVSVDRSILRPFTTDQFGRVTYSTPQTAFGTVLLNPLRTIQNLQNVYAYSLTRFPTTQFYRGSITTPTGYVPDALFFVERGINISYTNCAVGDILPQLKRVGFLAQICSNT